MMNNDTNDALPVSLFELIRDRSERETVAAQKFAAQYEYHKDEAHAATQRMIFLMREILALNDFELKAMAAFGRFFWTEDNSERELFLANLRIVLAGVDDNEASYGRVGAVLDEWLDHLDMSKVDTGALIETLIEAAAK